MAANTLDDRIAHLLAQAANDAKSGKMQQALQALKEASHLDAENVQVREAIVALQTQDESGDVANLLQRYLDTHEHDDGQRALLALQQKHLPEAEAKRVLDVLMGAVDQHELLDAATGALLHHSIYARKAVAARFSQPLSELFEKIVERGEESFKAFAAVPLDDAVWTSKDAQKTAQVDVFRLCIAKLIDCDISHPTRLMQAVARQLAVAPDHVKHLLDDDVLEIVLSNLDIRLEASLRSQSLLATSKILQITQEAGEQHFAHFLASQVARQTTDALVIAFSAAAAVFPLMPAVAANLFMTDGFVQQLVPNLERNSEAVAQGQRKSRTLEQAALELLSAACVNKVCREAVDQHCSSWLRGLSEERDEKHQALASLILAKINSASQEEITAKLADLVLVGDGEREQAVEGLAYTSLRPKIKEEIANNTRLLERLVAALRERPSAAFGCLTVFSNLTTYRPKQTAEQKKMEQLKAYANSQKPEAKDPLDNDAFVTARAKKLLEAGVVSAIVASSKQTSSPTNISMAVQVLLAISHEQKHRTRMVQEGTVRLLLQIRERIARTDKSTAEASTIERNASHSLARLLISINPAHVFSSGLPASSAVAALLPLLSPDRESEQRDLLPTFEALLALTNLASMEDPSARELQIRTAWDAVEELLFSSHTLVQRASVELVCNLSVSPAGAAKFADGSPAARRRMRILLALADAEDLPTRRAAGGALAMLTEWDAAAAAVLEAPRGPHVLLALCADTSDELRIRGAACALNVVSAPGAAGEKGVQRMKEADAAAVVARALRDTKSDEVQAIGRQVLQKLE